MVRKSQLKIQQMAFMLLAVILFFALVGMIFLTLRVKGFYEEANQIEKNRATLIARFIADSPEFSCGSEFYCVDTDRVVTFNTSSYIDFWPVAYIRFQKIYPEERGICTISSYPKCDSFTVFARNDVESTSSAGSFVALCRWERNERGYAERVCEFGKAVI